MYNNYYSSSLCPLHGEPFTNICTFLTCLTPLCPDCVDPHLKIKMHNAESIKNCKGSNY